MRARCLGLIAALLAAHSRSAFAEPSPSFTPGAHRESIPRECVALLPAPRAGTSLARTREAFAMRATAVGLTVVASLDDARPAGSVSATRAPRGPVANPFDLDPGRVVLLRAVDAAALAPAAAALAASGAVEWIEPNRERAICDFPADLTLPDDPLMRDTRQWPLWNAGAAGVEHGTAGADIGARAAWALTCGANDVRLAVADTGVDPAHPDLATTLADGTPRWVACRNVAAGPASAWADSNGHGTAMAGVMAALTDDGPHFDSLGVAGVCGGDGRGDVGCRIVPIKMTTGGSGFMSSFDIANAIVWATRAGARAINLSVAGGGDTRVERAALYFAITRGCVAVAASGNSGTTANPAVMYPAGYAADGLCVSVGASDEWDRRAAFSSYGPSLDLVAPGLDVWSTAPTYPNAFGAHWSGYLSGSGTSFAAPHVTGTIGLMVARRRDLADRDAQAILRATAHDIGAPGRDDATGWGRLDAAAAVRAADPTFALLHDEAPAEVRSTGIFAPLVVVADSFGTFDRAAAFSLVRAELHAATVTVTLPDSFADDAEVWPRTGGTMALRGDFTLAHWAPWAEVVARDGRRVTLRGYLYRVPMTAAPANERSRAARLAPSTADVRAALRAAGFAAAADSADLWLPLPPDEARIGYTIFGRRRSGPTSAVPGAAAHDRPLAVAPNPVRDRAVLTGPPAARVTIFDLSGRRVRSLVADGAGRVAWDGRDTRGTRVGAGLYFARLADREAPPVRIVRLE